MGIIKAILIFSITMSVFANYNAGYYGQKDFDLYFGSRELDYETNPINGNLIFQENKLENEYFDYLISPDLLVYKNYFEQELTSSLSCPQWEMDRTFEYMRYVNRIIALSYLYESIRMHYHTGLKLFESKKACEKDWKKILKSCTPKSKDMKLFVRSAEHILKLESNPIIPATHSFKKYTEQWQTHLSQKKLTDVSHYRLKEYCRKQNCSLNMTLDEIYSRLNQSCEEDAELFQGICSEEDSLYGLSNIQESYPLITNSDILTLYNENGSAPGCLRRYKQQNKHREIPSSVLKSIFPIVYQTLSQNPDRHSQGNLFIAGSLKQFSEKGLEDLYRIEKPIEEVKVAIKENRPSPVIKEDKVEFIDRTEKKKKVKKVVKVVEKKKPKKEAPKKSSFLTSVEMQLQFDLDSVQVDMLKFKYDYIFSIQLRQMLDENLEVYTTRQGLEQMKKNDKLGTKKGPMPLLFLKYLIETGKHQSLYNIMNVVGERFYVNNDIDPLSNTTFDYIQLQNDQSTDNQWQISVLKIPEEVQPAP